MLAFKYLKFLLKKNRKSAGGERVDKYNGWSYEELLLECGSRKLSGKEARAIHKELKKYGSGLPVSMRYPNFPVWISIASLLLVIIKAILHGMHQ